jgi:hypothetical protein
MTNMGCLSIKNRTIPVAEDEATQGEATQGEAAENEAAENEDEDVEA